MAAHLRPLHRCDRYGCDRPATQALHNNRNAVLGHYCGQHAKMALREFIKRHPQEGPAPR